MDRLNPFSDFMSKHGDPFVMGFPLLNNPVIMFGTIAGLAFGSKFIAPRYTKSCQSVDFKPFMMICNGLIFGLLGIGFSIGFLLTDFGTVSFDCKGIDPSSTNLRAVSIKLIAVCYLLIKLAEFMIPIYGHLRGMTGHNLTSNKYIGYLMGQASMAYLGAVFYPGGIFTLWPLVNAFTSLISYSYLILRTASDELRPNPVWRKIVLTLRYISFLALFLQGWYFHSVPNCGVDILTKIQLYYNLLLVVSMTSDLFNGSLAEKPRKEDNNNSLQQFLNHQKSG